MRRQWCKPKTQLEHAREDAVECACAAFFLCECFEDYSVSIDHILDAIERCTTAIARARHSVVPLAEIFQGHYGTPPDPIGEVAELSWHELALSLARHVVVTVKRFGGWNSLGVPTWSSKFAPDPARIDCNRAKIRDELAAMVFSDTKLEQMIRDESARAITTGSKEEVQKLHKNHVKILTYLDRCYPSPQTQEEMGMPRAVGLSERTIRDYLPKLRDLGLVHRPQGDKGGERITDEGRRALKPYRQ
jgi:hypothetical protein